MSKKVKVIGKKFYISDLHLFHEKMMHTTSNRCTIFDGVEQMNQTIINNWKSVVREQDTVYILGDVSMYNVEATTAILNDLPGHKHLIIGNHDPFNLENKKFRKCFESIKNYDQIRDKGRTVILFHYPIEEWNHFFTNSYHIHGHVHNNDDRIRLIDRRFNVSADVIDFTPRTLDELIEMRTNCGSTN